jgi:hypothetical protein
MTTSSTLLSWMAVASARGNSKLRMNLCIARDILDGILDDYPSYIEKHLPEIRAMFSDMNQAMVIEYDSNGVALVMVRDIVGEFEEKILALGV